MNAAHRKSRRSFLKSGTGLIFTVAVAPHACLTQATTVNATQLPFQTAFVEISSDGMVTIFSPAAEMGNGSLTALPVIIAEEMDVDWNAVRVAFSEVDDQIYSNPTFWHYGIMLTAGSSAVSGFYDQMRLTGAQIRKILINGASTLLSVPVSELTTELGVVRHTTSGVKLTYGEIANKIGKPDSLPEVAVDDLKHPTAFRLIGNPNLQRRDTPAKVHGEGSLYSIDVSLPGMLYATVKRTCFTNRAPLSVINEQEVMALPNIVAVTRLPDAVAVVATTYEAALAGESLLDIEWSQAEKDAEYNSYDALEDLSNTAVDLTISGIDVMGLVGQTYGDAVEALSNATKVHARTYQTDFMYHAQIEPLNAVASVTEDGAKIEIWAGTQTPTHLTRAIGEAMSVGQDDITLHRSYLGGAFGRRAAMDHDWALDAVRLSKIHGVPIKSIWSRESDINAGRFRPMSAHYLQATEAEGGGVSAFYHRTATDTPLRMSDQYRFQKGNGFPVITTPGLFPSYGYADYKAEIIRVESDVRISPMRGVGAFANVFARESFFDEIAHETNTDPLEFRRTLTSRLRQGSERAMAVLDKVKAMSDWDGRPGLGMCFAEERMAIAVELDVDQSTGLITMKHIWCATDVGIVVQPNNAENQIVGGLLFHLSNSLGERITFEKGKIQQSNYYNYHILKMIDTPPVDVAFIPSTEPPEGIGDFGTESIAAAIANAIYSATGKRVRQAPMTKERILEALKT